MNEEKQIKLQFEPIAHKYTDETGREYTSVTTVIGKYKEPFNMYTALRDSGFKVRPTDDRKSIVVSGKYRTLESLYRNPINCHEVNILINKWADLTEIACARGNKIHDYLEDSINLSKGDKEGKTNDAIKPQLTSAINNTGLTVEFRTQHDLDTTDLETTFPAIYKRLLAYINMGCIIYAEKKIYSYIYGIAGMIDVLIVSPHSKQFAILDWKTNKDEMIFQSGYYKKQKIGNQFVKTSNFIPTKDRLKFPLDSVPDCKGMVYTLQLSLYAYIMELWGYTLVKNGLEIFHMRPGLEPKLIRVAYLKKEVHAMLEHHKKNIHTIKSNTNTLFGIRP